MAYTPQNYDIEFPPIPPSLTSPEQTASTLDMEHKDNLESMQAPKPSADSEQSGFSKFNKLPPELRQAVILFAAPPYPISLAGHQQLAAGRRAAMSAHDRETLRANNTPPFMLVSKAFRADWEKIKFYWPDLATNPMGITAMNDFLQQVHSDNANGIRRPTSDESRTLVLDFTERAHLIKANESNVPYGLPEDIYPYGLRRGAPERSTLLSIGRAKPDYMRDGLWERYKNIFDLANEDYKDNHLGHSLWAAMVSHLPRWIERVVLIADADRDVFAKIQVRLMTLYPKLEVFVEYNWSTG